MKNGHCIAPAKSRPNGRRLRITRMAIGMAISRVSTVVPMANNAVFSTTRPKPASVNRRT